MTTINDRINRTARGLAWVSGFGFVAAFAITLAWWAGFLDIDISTAGKAVVASLLPAFGAFFLIYAVGARCPGCRENLVWYYDIRPFRLSDLRRCPRCRLDLDGPDPSADN
jgi:hypothetical protein